MDGENRRKSFQKIFKKINREQGAERKVLFLLPTTTTAHPQRPTTKHCTTNMGYEGEDGCCTKLTDAFLTLFLRVAYLVYMLIGILMLVLSVMMVRAHADMRRSVVVLASRGGAIRGRSAQPP